MGTKEKLLKLMADREKVEKKISDFGALLEANGQVGMQGPLVDDDGYPRNDIDVYQVRQARQQIICLQNDHKQLMKQIEQLLHELHAQEKTNHQQDISSRAADMSLREENAVNRTTLTAIAKVDMISPGSPAETAGIRTGDQVIEFGTINSTNFKDLTQIGELVRHMQNQRIPLAVKRDGTIFELMLIPKTWSGRGLLGCNIVLN